MLAFILGLGLWLDSNNPIIEPEPEPEPIPPDPEPEPEEPTEP